MSDRKKMIEEAADEEAASGYEWAFDYLTQKEPALCYEYGVKVGFKRGADFADSNPVADDSGVE